MPQSFAKQRSRDVAREQIMKVIRAEGLFGRRLLGDRDLARRLGINRGTVQQALADLEVEGVLERRHGSGTYVAEKERPVRGRTVELALVAGRPPFEQGWDYRGELIRGALGQAPRLRARCTEFYLNRKEDAERVRDGREMGRFGGFIVVSEDDRGLLAALLDLGCGPVVLLNHFMRDLAITNVVDGSFEGSRAVTRHLLGLGHRRIGYLDVHNRDAVNPEKHAGCRAALEAAGAFDESLVVTPPSRDPAELERFVPAALADLLARPNPPTALFCYDDGLALLAMRAAEARGLRVGADFSIAGHGDSASRRGDCDWLTSCRINPRRMGQEAVRAALAGQPSSESRTIIVPNRLMIRRSTGPLPGQGREG